MDGRPPFHLTVNDGIHGALATAAVVVNCIPRVLNAESGLVTMKALKVLSEWFSAVAYFLNK
jgi:hypothetical protein